MFLATGGEKLHDVKLDDAEDVETFLLELEEVKNLVKENKIVQSLHVNCILYALLHLKEASL
jgi:ADP-ribose pyrophosphatase